MDVPPLIRSIRHLKPRELLSSSRPIHNVLTTSSRRWKSSKAETTATPSTSKAPEQIKKEAPVRSTKPSTATAAAAVAAGLSTPSSSPPSGMNGPRFPRALQALHLQPLRRDVTYGVPTADLQLRSFHVRSLEFFCDFALRAAYYLNLPAFGPVPLPRITERWTVPRSHFIFKKSQENFERITYRRLIQIRDGHIDSVQIWLAFLRKHQYPGVGMKANVWEYSKLDVGKMMDEAMKDATSAIEPRWMHLGETKTLGTVEKVEELLTNERFNAAGGR